MWEDASLERYKQVTGEVHEKISGMSGTRLGYTQDMLIINFRVALNNVLISLPLSPAICRDSIHHKTTSEASSSLLLLSSASTCPPWVILPVLVLSSWFQPVIVVPVALSKNISSPGPSARPSSSRTQKCPHAQYLLAVSKTKVSPLLLPEMYKASDCTTNNTNSGKFYLTLCKRKCHFNKVSFPVGFKRTFWTVVLGPISYQSTRLG